MQARATQAQLAGAMRGSPANTNAVGTLDDAFSNPPTTTDLALIRGKLHELILAARR